MSPTVRTAELADVEAIAAIHVSSWEGVYRGMVPEEWLDARSVAGQATMWRELIGRGPGRARVLVAEQDGKVTGFGSANTPSRDDDADEDTAEISTLYVEPARWREGAGRALMAAMLSTLAAAGFETATLWVLEPNERARAFYAAQGFAPDGGRQRVADGWPEEIRLRRTLG